MGYVILSDGQAAAMDAVDAFMRSDRKLLTIHGLAGTGKSTLLAHVAHTYPHDAMCCLTGKAASVLREKTGLAVCTIHSYFYHLIDKHVDEDGRKQLTFAPKHVQGQLWGNLVLLDESSMVPESIGLQLLGTGARVVACGDPGQLRPVRGEPFFDRADVTLTEIQRQARESPIIRQAWAVRQGNSYRADTDDFYVRTGIVTPDDMQWADIMLCYTNAQRHRLNEKARRLRGHTGFPRAGEPILCLKNAAQYDVWNGGIYTLAAGYEPGDDVMQVCVDGAPVTIPDATWDGEITPQVVGFDDEEYEPTTTFDYGYALTVHKAQGSEWPRVVLVDDYPMKPYRREWVYTALTRAVRSIRVIR